MNNNARNDATDQPISLNNETTPDAAVFAGTAPAPTAVAAAGTAAVGGGGGGSLLQSDDDYEDLLVCDTMWLIYNPQWVYNPYFISASNK